MAELAAAAADEPPVTVTISAHEMKLLTALRAFPNRVAMWTSLGDPMRNHKMLLGMYSRFFQICEANGIEYWLEYGSVLGYVRHGGMIPWEWDMDIGCTPPNFAKLIEIGKEIEANDPVYGFKYYSDPDYESSAYCFYVKENDNCLCDIAEYREEGDLLVCAVEDWHYPPHKRSTILPPRKVTMCGQIGQIPARSDVFLAKSESILGQCTGDADESTHIKNLIPYMQYDPIPFLLCHMFRPDFAALACKPPAVDIGRAATIAEGFATFARAGKPFIVKGVKAFDFELAAFRARVTAEGLKTYGWNKKLEAVTDVVISDAFAQWEEGKLELNFVDSPIPKMVANEGIIPDLREVGINEDNLMLVLSNKGTYTPFHQDPVAAAKAEGGDSTTGGGWMWLLQGTKLWNFVDFEYTDVLFDKEANCVGDPTFENLVYADNYKLWGKVGMAHAEAGDFVYFPPGCNHRVWTYGDSVGIGGYAQFEWDKERVAQAMEWYKAKGLNPAHGMFQVVGKGAAVAAALEAAAVPAPVPAEAPVPPA